MYFRLWELFFVVLATAMITAAVVRDSSTADASEDRDRRRWANYESALLDHHRDEMLRLDQLRNDVRLIQERQVVDVRRCVGGDHGR
jgi:hypothetical protein